MRNLVFADLRRIMLRTIKRSVKFISSGITLYQQWELVFINSGKLLWQWKVFTGSDVRTLIMEEAHATKYSVHPRLSKSTTITTTVFSQQSQDKGKGIRIEEPMKPKMKDQIRLDKEAAKKLQAKFNEEERLVREKAKKEERVNIALIEEWDDIQAKIDADHQLTERLQAQEQEELSDVEKATLFQQLLEKRRKHFTAKRAEGKRNKLPIKFQ
nr:hypothetical protein [Tanacetum cinerariifolium]